MANEKLNINLDFNADFDKIDQFADRVVNAFRRLTRSAGNLSKSLGTLGNSLNTTLDRLDVAANKMAQTVDRIDHVKIANLGAALQSAFKGITGLGDAIKGLSARSLDRLDKFPAVFERLNRTMDKALAAEFPTKANKLAQAIQNLATQFERLNKARKEYRNESIPNPPQPRQRREQQATAPVQPRAPGSRQVGKDAEGFLGSTFQKIDEILPARGPLVQVTGLLFLLQGAYFGLVRVIDRVSEAVLGANKLLEQQVISLTAITGSAEKAKKVITDFALPFAASVPFFESKEIIEQVERLSAEGFGIDEITGRLDAGFNEFTGKFEREFSGGLIKTLASAAVAFGTTLDRSVDAFIAAVQGRFTKIRRFGIDKEDLKAFGFVEGGDTLENARALQRLEELRFGDLVRQQAKTFQGAISNIQDVLSNISRVAFEESFKRVSKALLNVAESLTIYEKAFSLALKTQEEYQKALKDLDPRTQRVATNLRAVSNAFGFITDRSIALIKALGSVKELVGAGLVAPIALITLNGLGFAFQKLVKSVGEFLGIVDGNALAKPKFLKDFDKFRETVSTPFKATQKLDILDDLGNTKATKNVSQLTLGFERLKDAIKGVGTSKSALLTGLEDAAKGARRLKLENTLLSDSFLQHRKQLTINGQIYRFGANSTTVYSRALKSLAQSAGKLPALFDLLSKGVTNFGVTVEGGPKLAGLLSKILPVIGQASKQFKLITGVASKFLGVLGAITTSVAVVVKTLVTGIGFVVKTAFAAASLAVSGFLGILRFFLLPAIIDAIFALRDMSKGVENLRTRSLDGLLKSLSNVGQAFQSLFRVIGVTLGYFTGFREEGGFALRVLTGLFDTLTIVLSKMQEWVPVIAELVGYVVRLAGTFLRVTGIVGQMIDAFVDVIQVFLALWGVIVKGIPVLNVVNTTLGAIARFAGLDDLATAFENVIELIGSMGKGLERTGRQLEKFQLGANLSSGKDFINQKLISGAFGKGFSDFAENVAQKDTNAFVEGLLGTKNTAAFADLKRNVQKNLLTRDQVFEIEIEGKITKVNFEQLVKGADPAKAAKELSKKLIPELQNQITKFAVNPFLSDTFKREKIEKLAGAIIKLQNLEKEAALFAEIQGNLSKSTADVLKAGKDSAEAVTEALKEFDKVTKRARQREGAFQNEVFFTRLAGGSKDAIENAEKRLSQATREGFKERFKALPGLAEVQRIANKNAVEFQQKIDTVTDQISKTSSGGVEKARALLVREFGNVAELIPDDALKNFVETADPAGEAASRIYTILSGKGQGGQFAELITRLEEVLRPTQQRFQDLSKELNGATEASKKLDEAAQQANKASAEALEQQQAKLKNTRTLVDSELEIGGVSLQQAALIYQAQRKLVEQNTQLQTDNQEFTDKFKRNISIVKELIQTLGADFKDNSRNNKGALRQYQDIVDAFLATRDYLATLPENAQKMPDIIDTARKSMEELNKASVDFVKTQLEAQRTLAGVAASIRTAQREARLQSQLVGITRETAPTSRIDAALRSAEAVNVERAAMQGIVEAESARLAALEKQRDVREQDFQLQEAIQQLQDQAKLLGDETINQLEVQTLQQERLQLVTENLTSLYEEQNRLNQLTNKLQEERESNAQREFDIMKQQAKKAQEIADIRKKGNDDFASFQKNLLKIATGQEELTQKQENIFLRKEVERTFQRLGQARSPGDRLSAAIEASKALDAAQKSGAFKNQQDRFNKFAQVLFNLQTELKNADFAVEAKLEFSKNEQLLQAIRTSTANIATELSKTTQALQQNSLLIANYVQLLGNVAGKAFDPGLLTGNIAQAFDERVKNAQNQGGFAQALDPKDTDKLIDNSIITGRVELKNGPNNTIQRNLDNQAQNISKTNDNLKTLQGLVNESMISAIDNSGKLGKALETYQQQIERQTAEVINNIQSQAGFGTFSAVGNALQEVPNAVVVSRLEALETKLPEIVRTNAASINPQAEETDNSQTQRAVAEVSRALTQVAELLEREKDVNINLTLDAAEFNGDQIKSSILQGVFNALQVTKNPRNDIN